MKRQNRPFRRSTGLLCRNTTFESAIQGNRKRHRPDAIDQLRATLMHPAAETGLISESPASTGNQRGVSA